jgi:hypothetical protein
MTTVNDLFPSKYLKAADAENDLTLTIARVTKEKMKNNDGEEEVKPIVYFVEHEKGMVLNRTNANTLTDLFGEQIEAWTGQKIVLASVDVDAFGKIQKALRIRADAPKVSREDLLKRYGNLFAEAQTLKVDDLDTFLISADASEKTIIELGKNLRAAVNSAKAF